MSIILAVVIMGLLGWGFGFFLAALDKALKVKDDPKVEEIIKALPGINCGACGEAGCAAYAKKCAFKKDMGQGCIPGGADVNGKIASILGLDKLGSDKIKVICKCLSKGEDQVKSFEYKGAKSCSVAHLSGGNIDCKYGCIGFGDCVNVCPVGALKVVNGHVDVDNNTCIDCGKCIKACPRNLFEFVNVGTDKSYYVVGCNNPEFGQDVKKVCSAGCIGCGICVKVVPESPFFLEQKIAKIDYTKARGKNLDMAVNKCPTRIIRKKFY